jgi:hypothetical protein
VSSTPVTPVSAADRKIYAVAGGNHVTIELDRAMTGGLLDVIEVLAQPGGGPRRTVMPSANRSWSGRASSPCARNGTGWS